MSLGPLQIILIIVVILLLFGAGKIPRLMGDMAKGVNAFKKGLKDGDEPSETVKKDNQIENDTDDKKDKP